MGERNGQTRTSTNVRERQVEEQTWDHLLSTFDRYVLREILEWCHVFRVEKEKKRMLLDEINSEIPVRLKKNVIYSPQLFADLGLSYYEMEYYWVERIPLQMTEYEFMTYTYGIRRKQQYAGFHKNGPYRVPGAWHSFVEDWRYDWKHVVLAGPLLFNRYGRYLDPAFQYGYGAVVHSV